MSTELILKALHDAESRFGTLEVKHHSAGHWTAGLGRLVEIRGDGLRHLAVGFGDSEEEAVQELWNKLTASGTFFSVAQNGYDLNYGWTGTKFVRLPSTEDAGGIYGVMDALNGFIPDLPSSYSVL